MKPDRDTLSHAEVRCIEERLQLPPLENELKEWSSERGVVVYGASSGGQRLIEKLRHDGVCVAMICDSDYHKWNSEICGMLVRGMQHLAHLDRNIPILVASVYHEQISPMLIDVLKFRRVFTDIFQINAFLEQTNSALVKTDNFLLKDNLEEVANLFEMITEDKSRYLLQKIIKMRLYPNTLFINNLYTPDQYFSSDVISFNEQEIFVDVGAFLGDTVVRFANAVQGRFRKILAFEPDRECYVALCRNMREHQFERDVCCMNMGLHETVTEMPLYYAPGQSVYMTTLDSVLGDETVSFIKMDIEGYELPALAGAAKTIRRCRPKLAICVYHKLSDLWRIPLFIKHLVPDYSLRFRLHNRSSPAELVCYATL